MKSISQLFIKIDDFAIRLLAFCIMIAVYPLMFVITFLTRLFLLIFNSLLVLFNVFKYKKYHWVIFQLFIKKYFFQKQPPRHYKDWDKHYSQNYSLIDSTLNFKLFICDPDEFYRIYVNNSPSECCYFKLNGSYTGENLSNQKYNRKQDIVLLYSLIRLLVVFVNLFYYKKYVDNKNVFPEIATVYIIVADVDKSLENIVDDYKKQQILLKEL